MRSSDRDHLYACWNRCADLSFSKTNANIGTTRIRIDVGPSTISRASFSATFSVNVYVILYSAFTRRQLLQLRARFSAVRCCTNCASTAGYALPVSGTSSAVMWQPTYDVASMDYVYSSPTATTLGVSCTCDTCGEASSVTAFANSGSWASPRASALGSVSCFRKAADVHV